MKNLAKGTEIAPDFVVAADESKRDKLTGFHPDDAGCPRDSSLKDFVSGFRKEMFDTKAHRSLASMVVSADLSLGFVNQELVITGKSLKLL
jgi:hypothetical protein